MSPRSALVFVLLFAAFTAAEAVWSDIMLSATYNVTAVKYCTVNTNPPQCYFFPAWNASVDPRKGLAVVETFFYGYGNNFMAVPSLYMLKMIYSGYYDIPAYSLTLYIDRPGYLWSQFANFTVDGKASGPWSICNGTVYLSNAYRIQKPDTYKIAVNDGWGRADMLRFYEEASCAQYAVVDSIEYANYLNITQGWIPVALIYLKTGRQGDIQNAWQPWATPVATWINGTKHLYRFRSLNMFTIGGGWYIANKTQVPTILMRWDTDYYYYGPTYFDALRKTPIYWQYGNAFVQPLTIGADPGDGAVFIKLPTSFYGKAEFAYIGNETAGYFNVTEFWMSRQSAWADRDLVLTLQRYSLVEVAVKDLLYLYTARGLACPPYENMTAIPPAELQPIRMDRAREFQLCNNQTAPVYAGLYVGGYYTFVDKIEPGKCVPVRWDGQYANTQTRLNFFYSPQDYCLQRVSFYITGGNYTYGYRYFLMPNNTLMRGPPTSPDTAIIDMWNQLIKLMAQQYNETQNAIKRWLQLQSNMTKSIEEYYKSLPRYQDTVKIDSSTSTWLQTVLNVIGRYAVPGASVGVGATAALPGTSSLSAAAAAATVATAWAASRRSLATAALLAGFAVLASALFVYYLFGTSVTAALVLAAVVLMSVGAAAAWFRRSED